MIGTVEAAEILGVDRSTLTRWVQLNKIPEAKRISGSVRGARLFWRSDVEALRDELTAAS